MTPFSLAKVFADLANDPRWPWESNQVGETGKPRTYWTIRSRVTGKIVAAFIHYQVESESIAQSPLTMARLALMVVEVSIKAETTVTRYVTVRDILESERINPSHYANVKQRVEEADTEEKGN